MTLHNGPCCEVQVLVERPNEQAGRGAGRLGPLPGASPGASTRQWNLRGRPVVACTPLRGETKSGRFSPVQVRNLGCRSGQEMRTARVETWGSNPHTVGSRSIGVVAAHLVLNQTVRVRLPHGLRTRPRGGPLGEVVLSTSEIHTPRTGSARGRFAAVAVSTWTCGATGAQLVYTESVGGSNPSGFTADACGNPYSARAGCGQFERCAWRLSSGQSALWS